MLHLINSEDWVLVLTVLGSLLTLPVVMATCAAIFKIPLFKIFNKGIWVVVAQLFGIVILTLLLLQVSIHSDGMGAKLIYGRF